MTTPLYVSLDTLDLTTSPYAIRAFSAPEPDLDSQAESDLESQPDNSWWPRDLHDESTVTLTVEIRATTAAAALTAVNALRKAAHSDATIYARQEAQTTTLSKLIYHASVQGPFDLDTVKLRMQAQGCVEVMLTLTCYPYWVAPEVALTPAETSSVPGTVTFSDIPGEVPALTMLRVTSPQATTGIALGLRSNPPDPALFAAHAVQDYPVAGTVGVGIANGDARGGFICRQTATTSWARADEGGTWIAPPFGVSDMRGRYVAWARALWSTNAATNMARIASDVTGSGIVGVTNAYNSVTASPAGTLFEVANLGELSIPAGEVPAAASSASWNDTHAIISQAVGGATDSSTIVGQKFLLTGLQKVSAVSLTLTAASGYGRASILNSGFATIWTSPAANFAVGENIFPVSPEITLQPGVYTVLFAKDSGTWAASYSTADVYADYPRFSSGAGGWTTGDLVFSVYGRDQLGFWCHSAVEIKAATGVTYDLDSVALLPCDESYFAVNSSFAATQGVLIDESGLRNDSVNAYLCDSAGGVGASLISSVDPRNPFLLRPGTNVIVAVAKVPAMNVSGETHNPPANLTVAGSYWPRYLSLSAGD